MNWKLNKQTRYWVKRRGLSQCVKLVVELNIRNTNNSLYSMIHFILQPCLLTLFDLTHILYRHWKQHWCKPRIPLKKIKQAVQGLFLYHTVIIMTSHMSLWRKQSDITVGSRKPLNIKLTLVLNHLWYTLLFFFKHLLKYS